MFSHREDKRDDRQLDILTDEENGLRIIVSRLGAELISLARANEAGEWIGFLYRDNDLTAPAQGWANHATVMGYYLHRLKDGRSLYRGREIKGGTHGFLRSQTWHFVESKIDNRSLTYRITPQDFSATEYPLKVSLDLTYRMDMSKVSVEFAFQNDEKELREGVERARGIWTAPGVRRDFVRELSLADAGRLVSAAFFSGQLSFR